MMKVMFMGIILLLLSCILCCLAMLLSKKSYMDREKMSAFECGFDPFSSSRLPFSLRFYLIALIFLIFDVELVLLMPLVLLYDTVIIEVWGLVALIFAMILLIGLYYEWDQGALNWK
uniref:NADH-ubiquinone oxidoreductase chain 3 n=1 Tax=Cloeon dipterum TaxID=197152 RepID=A0A6C0R220_9INSE|nr:NADH dehydrogenase subunit 3 [Cloeon dipterum]